MPNARSRQFCAVKAVQTGEVGVATGEVTLTSTAIGSCIAVVAYDQVRRVGGIAHIMLPGRAPDQGAAEPATRYANNGFEMLLGEMHRSGARHEDIRACIVGGANVLKDPHDSICQANIDAVVRLCEVNGLAIAAQSTGGTERRRVSLDLQTGAVCCGIGDGPELALWSRESGVREADIYETQAIDRSNLMTIREDLLEVREFTNPGYAPVIDFSAWRVAVLNYIDELLPGNLATLQRHDETDEVFVLLRGRCILFIGEGDANRATIHAEDLRPLRMYNVKKSVWHTHTLSKDAMVLIVENRDTTAANSPKIPLSEDQRRRVVELTRALWGSEERISTS